MIYVLIPAHNEAATVGLLLWKVRQVFTAFSREYQMIVVNDGSTDASHEVLAPYVRALPLTLLTHRMRRGYAASLEALFREAMARTDRPRRDLAVTLQADFSESPDDIPELIKRIEGGADIVVGERPRARRGPLVARAVQDLARRAAGVRGARDVVGTMRGYRLAVVDKMLKDAGTGSLLGRDGWAADTELLLRAARHARKIETVPLTGAVPSERRPSRAAPLAASWQVLRTAVSLRGELPAVAAGPADEPAEVPLRAEREVKAGAQGPPRRGEDEDRRRDRPRREQEPRGERRRKQGRAAAAAAPAAEERRAAPATAEERHAAPASGEARRGKRKSRRERREGRERREAERPADAAPASPAEAHATATPVHEATGSDVDPSQAVTPVDGTPAVSAPAGQHAGRRRRRRRGGRGRGRNRGGPASPETPGGAPDADAGDAPAETPAA